MQTKYALAAVSVAAFLTAMAAAGEALLKSGGISATDAAVVLLAVAVCVLALRLGAAETKIARLRGDKEPAEGKAEEGPAPEEEDGARK